MPLIEEADRLRTDLLAKQARIEELEGSLEEWVGDFKGLRADLAAERAEREWAQDELGQVRVNLRLAQQERDAALAERDTLAQRVAALEREQMWVLKELERQAALYVKADGAPGPLCNTWGWRDSAATLREVASDIRDRLAALDRAPEQQEDQA